MTYIHVYTCNLKNKIKSIKLFKIKNGRHKLKNILKRSKWMHSSLIKNNAFKINSY